MRIVRRPSAVLAAVILSVGVAVGAAPVAGSAVPTEPPVPAPSPPASIDLAELKQQADATGTVPVLVVAGDGGADTSITLADELDGTGSTVRTVTDRIVAVRADAEGLERLAQDPSVTAIGPDWPLRLEQSASGPAGTGAPTVHPLGLTGAGRTVALIDTGVDGRHPSLAGAVVAEACFLAGVQGTCPNGRPTQVGAGAGVPCRVAPDPCGHGTHVAGILAGRPVAGHPTGTAPGVRLVSVRVFGEDRILPGAVTARTSDLIAALEHVRQLHRSTPIDAINLSLSGDPLYPALCDGPAGADPAIAAVARQVDQLKAAGVAVVSATGNGGDGARIAFPACLAGMVRVAATDGTGALASFSNRNPEVPLAAPGVDVVSATPGGGLEARSGTSMAAPHVTGAIALLRQRYAASDVDWLTARLRATGRIVTDPDNGRQLRRIDLPAALGLTPAAGGTPVAAAGAWVVTDRGRILPTGRARDHGRAGAVAAGERVVAGAATTSGLGYWLATDRGRVLTAGDAPFLGDVRTLPLNRPITGMAPTPSGRGYWLLGGDGGVFSFGDAGFHGSTGSLALNAPVTDLAATPSGRGYWFVARDGGVFSFGDAAFRGSTASLTLNAPITSISAGPRDGYWLVASDGGVFAFSVPFLGSLPGSGLQATGHRIRASALGSGYHILTTAGTLHPYGRAEAWTGARLQPGERAVDLLLLP